MKRGLYHIAVAILTLTLPACIPRSPGSLVRSSPDLSGTLSGAHGALARCALHALKDHYAKFAWNFDLQEFPREDRTQVIVKFVHDTLLVADFRQQEDSVAVTMWQPWAILTDPKTVAWDGAKTCSQQRGDQEGRENETGQRPASTGPPPLAPPGA